MSSLCLSPNSVFRIETFSLLLDLHSFSSIDRCTILLPLLEVVAYVLHDRVLEGVWTLEEIGTLLALLRSRICIHVFVEQFPEVIGKTEGFKVAGITAIVFAKASFFVLAAQHANKCLPESGFELLGS